MLELLIRELDPSDKNGRYNRENFRRIKQYLDDAAAGTIVIMPVSVPSPAAFNAVDIFDTTVLNQTVFVLTGTPLIPSNTLMTVNGVEINNGTHFTILGSVVTFKPLVAGYQLEVLNEFGQPDKIIIKYTK